MEKYNYTRVSDFIRDAVLDKRLTQRQVVEIEPYKIDNNRLVPQVIDAIRTYDFRLALAITAFEEAIYIPYVDPELIYIHARRLRLIGAALGGIEAIYLGAMMSDEEKQTIIHLAKKLNKNIKIYQMTVNPDAFKLDVSEVVQDA